MIHMQNYAIQI
ncbi:hypothetical protein BLA29_005110 [Euroglyphus maynei]|uniref:Uncharacterized protein n=1 Tax=Euroglyphus maynei TaxID=6958 RepID=A0A1Y3BSP0_EURMA|nr:hypothetical protein BLA29_005110 [Euroglyphus maynei]